MAPFRIAQPRFLAYFAFEGGLVFAVLYGLAHLTRLGLQDQIGTDLQLSVSLVGAAFSLLLLFTHLSGQATLGREILLFSAISFVLGLAVFAVLWVLLPGYSRISGLLLLEGAIGVPLSVGAWRAVSTRFELLNVTRERLLIVGTGESARQVCRAIKESHSRQYSVVGFVDGDRSRMGEVLSMGTRIQTDYASLGNFSTSHADRVIVALDEKRGKFPARQLIGLRLQGIEVEESTSFFERVSGKIAVETLLPSWLIFSDGFKTSSFRSAIKRIADLVLSISLLVASAPALLLTIVAVKLDSRGPILYRQTRLGRNGREFYVLKFRSMRQDAEATSGPTWAAANDTRVTRVGKIIRKLRVDELPQLFNVLRGEMSFVGPRPERAHFVRQFEEKIPYYQLRMTVRPGITGWAQVEYPYGASEHDALQKLKYDLYYIKNNSLLLDLWIVLKTVKVCLLGAGAR
jgi:sugar transferase (PEP-CTERM system associated)